MTYLYIVTALWGIFSGRTYSASRTDSAGRIGSSGRIRSAGRIGFTGRIGSASRIPGKLPNSAVTIYIYIAALMYI